MAGRWVLPESGSWVGPPVLQMQLRFGPPTVLDGRRRLAEIEQRGLLLEPPVLVVTNHVDAVTQLVLAGHHARAASHINDYAPHLVDTTATALAKMTGLAHQRFSRMVGILRDPKMEHRRKRYAMDVVKRGLKLYERMEEGHRPELADLRDVLGDFFK